MIQKIHTLLPLSILFISIQGCTLKEERVQTPKVQQPVHKPIQHKTLKPALKTPQTPIVKTVPHIQPTPTALPKPTIVVQRYEDVFANAKTMRLPTINNKTITIKAQDNLLKVTSPHAGKEVVLYLFGRDCVHCRNEISQIRKLARKPNLKIIGIHAQKDIGDKALKAYAKKIGYNFDILSFQNDVQILKYLDYSGLWGGGTPSHLLIDAGGNVQDMSVSRLLKR